MSAVVSETGTRFRPACESDLQAILSIEQAAYDFPWSRKLMEDCLNNQNYFAAMIEQGQLIGYGILSCVLDEAHLLNICIDPVWQGGGKGKILLFHLIDVARQKRAEIIFLEVRLSNVVGQNLYESNGFNQLDVRKDYYPNGKRREDAIVYARSIL